MKNVPRKIYLVTGLDRDTANGLDFKKDLALEEVGWAESETESGDVGPYVLESDSKWDSIARAIEAITKAMPSRSLTFGESDELRKQLDKLTSLYSS